MDKYPSIFCHLIHKHSYSKSLHCISSIVISSNKLILLKSRSVQNLQLSENVTLSEFKNYHILSHQHCLHLWNTLN